MTYPPQPERRFMNLSVGVLALVVTALILLPVVGCLACCALGGLGAAVDPSPSTSP